MKEHLDPLVLELPDARIPVPLLDKSEAVRAVEEIDNVLEAFGISNAVRRQAKEFLSRTFIPAIAEYTESVKTKAPDIERLQQAIDLAEQVIHSIYVEEGARSQIEPQVDDLGDCRDEPTSFPDARATSQRQLIVETFGEEGTEWVEKLAPVAKVVVKAAMCCPMAIYLLVMVHIDGLQPDIFPYTISLASGLSFVIAVALEQIGRCAALLFASHNSEKNNISAPGILAFFTLLVTLAGLMGYSLIKTDITFLTMQVHLLVGTKLPIPSAMFPFVALTYTLLMYIACVADGYGKMNSELVHLDAVRKDRNARARATFPWSVRQDQRRRLREIMRDLAERRATALSQYNRLFQIGQAAYQKDEVRIVRLLTFDEGHQRRGWVHK